MGIFFKENDGCNGHHFGNYSKTGEFRIKDVASMHSTAIKIQEREMAFCQHDGCSEVKKRWETSNIFRSHRAQQEFKDFLRNDMDLVEVIKERHGLMTHAEAHELFNEGEEEEADD